MARKVLKALGALTARQGLIYIGVIVVNWTVSDRIGQNLQAQQVDAFSTTVICNCLYLLFLAVHGVKKLCVV